MVISKGLTVRWLIRRDMTEILNIERLSFENPWTEEDFLSALRYRNTIGTVAEIGTKVIGFQIHVLFKRHLEIINMAVAPELRNQGIGSQIIHRLKNKLDLESGKRAIVVKVRETNVQMQTLLRGHGFVCDKVVKGYYEPKNSEDMYRMIYSISERFEYED